VKQHKGYINVYSEPSNGSVFTLYFPAAMDTFAEERPVIRFLPRGKESILVAEDNQGVRDLMCTVLARYGYTIVEAVDGEEAIGKLDACAAVDLMIVDSVMPKKNGRQVLDEIRKRHSGVKVLFTSGYTRDVMLDKGIEEKEVDFLAKPISPYSLLSKVREVLDRR
jgi:two-component system cell cycle sensor histidine kinase/response regulator CckA